VIAPQFEGRLIDGLRAERNRIMKVQNKVVLVVSVVCLAVFGHVTESVGNVDAAHTEETGSSPDSGAIGEVDASHDVVHLESPPVPSADCYFDGDFETCYDNDTPQACETMVCCTTCNTTFMVCEAYGERCTCKTPCG
jgi:hypothetical protein